MIDEDALKRIEELHRLQKEGIISAEEFEKSKQAILFGGKAAKPQITASVDVPVIERPSDDDWLAWMILPLKRYVQFTGRSSRKEFWMFQLLYILMMFGAGLIAYMDKDVYGETGFVGKSAVVLLVLALAGMFIPLIAVEVRRFHDQDRSGWLALLNLIPYIGPLIIYVFMLFPGTKGDNRFGPEP